MNNEMNELVQEMKTNTKVLFFSNSIKMKEKLFLSFSFVSITKKKLIALGCFSPNFFMKKICLIFSDVCNPASEKWKKKGGGPVRGMYCLCNTLGMFVIIVNTY